MRPHRAQRVDQRGAPLDAQPLHRVGVVARPGLRREGEHAGIEPAATARARLEQHVRETGGQAPVQVVDAEDVAVEELALAVGRQPEPVRLGDVAVHVPLDVRDRGALEDLGRARGRGGPRPPGGPCRAPAAGGSPSAADRGCRWPNPDARGTDRFRAETISGSIQSPKSSPSPVIRAATPSRPSGSLRRSTIQSPSEVVSSSRAPNQPSSSTNSSTPSSRAEAAMATSLSASKSK